MVISDIGIFFFMGKSVHDIFLEGRIMRVSFTVIVGTEILVVLLRNLNQPLFFFNDQFIVLVNIRIKQGGNMKIWFLFME